LGGLEIGNYQAAATHFFLEIYLCGVPKTKKDLQFSIENLKVQF
jgi:hypothetical protein